MIRRTHQKERKQDNSDNISSDFSTSSSKNQRIQFSQDLEQSPEKTFKQKRQISLSAVTLDRLSKRDKAEQEESVGKVSSAFIIFIYVAMVLGGTLSTIFSKMIGQTVQVEKITGLNEDGSTAVMMVDSEFKHPLILNLLMFTGEALLLLVLAIQLYRDPVKKIHHMQTRANPVIFAVPALFDTLGSFCCFTGLSILAASTF